MKGLAGKFRLSRKLLVIFGGVSVLCGGTGAAAVYIGADQLLGPSYAELNGLECSEVKTVTIQKKDRFWVRKFITTESTDGSTRVKTALRVAAAVYDAKKPDLVQVVVLDKNGPKDRAEMRGRAVGADVLYIPDPAKVPEETAGVPFSARYIDKSANDSGQFYGERIILPLGDVEALFARLNDKTDCITPVIEGAEGHGAPAAHGEAGAHGAPAGHGEASGHEDSGHGADAGKGEAAGHGETDGHGAAETPVAEGHGAEPAHGEEAKSGGWFASIKGMVFGSDDAAPAEVAHGETADAPAEDEHGAQIEKAKAEHGAEAPAVAQEADHATTETAAEGHAAAPEHSAPAGHAIEEVEQASAEPVEAQPAEEPAHSADAAKAEDDGKSWLGSLQDLVWGDGEDEANAAKEAEASTPNIDEHAKDAANADAAGAAWLAKLKSKPAGSAEGGADGPDAANVPAEDSHAVPSKTDEHASAGH